MASGGEPTREPDCSWAAARYRSREIRRATGLSVAARSALSGANFSVRAVRAPLPSFSVIASYRSPRRGISGPLYLNVHEKFERVFMRYVWNFRSLFVREWKIARRNSNIRYRYRVTRWHGPRARCQAVHRSASGPLRDRGPSTRLGDVGGDESPWEGGVQISTGEPIRFCRGTNRILAD